tara:strand:+ start:21908 stop:22987 length:1080 start_codon:yes stop_codon:yes gene_type:complete
MFRRFRVLLVFCILLSVSTFSQANPGGVGDGIFDMQCGGACHGDSSLNQTSSALIEFQIEGTPYLEQPISINAVASGSQLSIYDKIGLFLLTDTTGHSDTPRDAGWEVLSDSNGGTNNYLEGNIDVETNNISASWTIKPTELTTTMFYVSIHHGGDDVPYFGISQGFELEVLPIPENLPRLAADFTPQTNRDLGEETIVKVETEEVSSVLIEWKIEGSTTTTVIANSSEIGTWQFNVPASNQPSILQWRAILDGEGPSQTTPWFTLVAQEPPFEVDEAAVYLQSFALFIFVIGIVLTLQIRYFKEINEEKQWEQTETIIEQNSSNNPPPLPNGQLPPGWTMEQWEWYGHEYINEQEAVQ